MTRARDRIRDQTGTAMVEFALVLPLLLFIALGIVDFGRAINYWNDTNQIAGDAARFAAVNNNPGASASLDFRDWIRNQAETGELKEGALAGAAPGECPSAGNPDCSTSVTSKLRVCIDSPTNQPLTVGNPIRVRVESVYNLIPLVGQKLQFGNVGIKGQAIMRLEQNYTHQTGCSPA